MVERIRGWLTPGGSLRGAAQRKTVGGLSRGRPACQSARSIAVWRPLLQAVYRNVGLFISLAFFLGLVATSFAVSSDEVQSSREPHEPQTTSQTSDLSDPPSAIRESRQSAIELVPGVPIERELKGGETHSYRITLASGQYLHAVVDQRGIEVVVKLLGPDGQQIVQIYSMTGTHGPVPVYLVAEASGEYRLEVRPHDEEPTPGRYEVRVGELREAVPQDQSRMAAQRAFAEGTQLDAQGTAESRRRGIEKYEEALTLWQAVGDRLGEVYTLTGIGNIYASLGEAQKELDYLSQALPLWQAVGDRRMEAMTLNDIGLSYVWLGENQKGLNYFGQALPVWQALGDRVWEVIVLNNIGWAYDLLGEKQKALDYYGQSLQLSRAIGYREGEAFGHNNIGSVYGDLGEKQKELDHLGQALQLFRILGDRRMEAVLLNNIGKVYDDLGEYQKALDYLNQALPLRRAVGHRRGEAGTLSNIGWTYEQLGEYQKALDYFNQALALFRAIEDRRSEASTLSNIGWAYGLLGEYQKALDYFNQALPLRRAVGDRQGEANTLNNIGRTYTSLGEHQKALDYFNQALPLRRAVGDQGGEAVTLAGIARVERDRGNLTEARTQMEVALNIIESLRTKAPSAELRASFLASKQNDYEFYTDLLMRLYQRQPSAGHDAAALQASERARARSLLETLTETRADIRQGVDPKLLERERTLQRQLNAQAERLTRLLSGQHTEEQAAAAKKELASLLTQYQEVQAQIRATSPRYAALTQPQPLSLNEIQQQVLGEDTLLLEYALGEERSYLWAVTPTAIKSYELPKRAEIDAAARRVYDLLVKKADVLYPEALTRLSEMLLGPVADQLGNKRLLIVSDGALQYIPFGALPKPVVSGQWSVASKKATTKSESNCPPSTVHCPLIVDHEIVSLPSASVLAAQRRELAGRQPAAKTVAVLADPVFDENDPRVKSRQGKTEKNATANDERRPMKEEPSSSNPHSAIRTPQLVEDDLTRSARDVGVSRFARLKHTRQEAEQIVRLAPKGEILKAVDFTASKPTAQSGELSQYQVVHFATHGLLNSQQPELSGLVLSLVNGQGEPQDGFLRMHEVYNVNLPAELVVLSGCKTGLGKDIRGEGLVGLTRAFMYAGAARVVVSLWSVSDVGTAELMKRFYEAMLKRGLRPAAALRAAQVSMWREKRWEAPYYWAGFVIQGEWR